MDNNRLKRASRFLALVLRHEPQRAGVRPDPQGWVDVEQLLAGCREYGLPLTAEELHQVVTGNDKQRFALSADGSRIRAQQGHSIAVDLGLEPCTPPELLYHGTVGRFLPAIKAEGLRPMSRHDVHLCADVETARAVAMRRGKPVILAIEAGRMHGDGHVFRVTGNGVWLTASVPSAYFGTGRRTATPP